MREAIGGTWLFQIVIIFILLFTGFMCLSINRSKAKKKKNQIIQTIQSYNGINLNQNYEDGDEGPLADIVSYITANSYRTTGEIPTDHDNYVCYSRDGRQVNSNPVFCIARVNAVQDAQSSSSYDELPNMYYYHVVVFYQLDLPVFHELFNFKVVGDTKILYGDVLS